MADYSKRSLRKSVDKLTVEDKKLLDRFTCDVAGCGSHFVFRITKDAYDNMPEDKRRYQGTCDHCKRRVAISGSALKKWKRVIDGGEVEIIETSFNQIFDLK